jgi:hypothetical protein
MPRLLAVMFVMIALPTGAMLAALTPPGQVADEPGHVARAAALLGGALSGERRLGEDGVERSGVFVDPSLWHALFVLRPGGDEKLDRAALRGHRDLGWDGRLIFMEIGPIALYLPLFYLPSAAALGLGHLAGLRPYDAVVAGRLGSLLCFIALGAAALVLARRGRATMFCALACPMSLSLAASFNQDGLLIATSVLAAALATRADGGSRLGATAALACVIAVKPPYLPLAALLLLHSEEPCRGRWLRTALVGLPAAAWFALMLATVAAPVPRAAYAPGPLWPGDPATVFSGTDPLAQARVLLADPLRLLWLPAVSLIHDPWLARQAVGVLGWLKIALPPPLYALWFAALACALLADLPADAAVPAAPGLRRRLAEAGLLAAAMPGAVWAIYLSQYLAWTNVGLDRIEGVSGRYLLPLLPLAGVALGGMLPPARRAVWRRLQAIGCAAPVLAGLAGFAVLPPLVAAAYYLR